MSISNSNKLLLIILTAIMMLLCASILLYTTTSNSVSAENYTTEWSTSNMTINNNVNDYTFKVQCYIRWDTTAAAYRVRIYDEDLTDVSHYFNIPGYVFNGFSGFTDVASNQYYEILTTTMDLDIVALYVGIDYTITFFDSYTDEVIGKPQTVTAGNSATAPTAPKHSGYIFYGWSGGDYESVTRSASIYAVYKAVRYVKVITPDDDAINLEIWQGASLEDVLNVLDYDFGRKWFKCFKDNSGNELNYGSFVITEDCTLVLKETNTGHGKLLGIMWYWYVGILGLALISGICAVNK